MIFYVIFGDFVGWDWGTPAILQQKHPWKNWIKIWDWMTPPPQLGQKTKFFQCAYLKAPLIISSILKVTMFGILWTSFKDVFGEEQLCQWSFCWWPPWSEQKCSERRLAKNLQRGQDAPPWMSQKEFSPTLQHLVFCEQLQVTQLWSKKCGVVSAQIDVKL